jgi:hypothetical protein
MPKAPRPARKRPDWTPGPWRYDSAAGEVRTAGPAPRPLAVLRGAGRDRRPGRETEADGQLMAAAPWLAETLGALCDASAALLDAVDGVAAGATGMAPDEAPPDFFEAYAAVQAALSDGVMAVASAHIEGWADDAEAAGWSGPAARRPAARASSDDPPG